jgi:HAMP domain-containing protein
VTADLRTESERRGTLLERRRAADRRRAGSSRDGPADDATFNESTLLVPRTPPAGRAASGPAVSFGARLTLALLAAALLPILGLGALLVALGAFPGDPAAPRLVLLAGVVTSLLGVLFASFLSATLTAPLRAIAAAVDQVSAGNLGTPIEIEGDDELARLAESHNRLAADLERRNRELGQILAAIDRTSVDAGTELLLERAAADARRVFGLVDVELRLVDPGSVPVEPRVPGEPLPIRAELRAGDEAIGLLIGHAPATRRWDRGDQDLFALFASEVGAALRTADLLGLKR